MNLLQALKAVAPAVGDGKLIPQHAYVLKNRNVVFATKGDLLVEAHLTDGDFGTFCVPYEALLKALDREGAAISRHDESGITIQAGRSRIKLHRIDEDTFPGEMSFTREGPSWQPEAGFSTALETLAPFTAGSDAHIWQMGIHFREHFAFAANAFAMAVHDFGSPVDISFPPWAVKFMAAQAERPSSIERGTNSFRAHWPETIMTSRFLIEELDDRYHTFAESIPGEGGVPVPDNLKEVMARLKSYGVKRFRIGAGKITHLDERIEIEEEVDLDVPPRIWGVEQVSAALEYASHINLTGNNGSWHGPGYRGMFAGMSG